ncbi:MAG: hypothetical protein ACM3ZT_08890 [Bacillota bacterium]
MHGSKSAAIDEILSKSDDSDHYEPEGRPGRKPGAAKPPVKPQGRDRQAWRAIEDLKDNRRLDRKLKEIYDED